MKKLLKILALILVLVLCLNVLASCNIYKGNGDETGLDGTESETGGEYQIPDDEYTIPLEEGYNQITFYWAYPGVIENADVWVWWDGKEGNGYLLHECDYGAKAVINVPEGIEQVGFIVRTDCSEPGGSAWGQATKDFSEDRFAIIDGKETFIYLKSGDGAQYSSNDGGKTLEMIKKFTLAGMVKFDKIQYSITPSLLIDSYKSVKVYEGERALDIIEISTIGKEASTGYITLDEKLDISKAYEVEIEGYGRRALVPTSLFDSPEFIEKFTYDGDDLGAVIDGDKTTFKVWAPTAQKVMLDLYSDGHTDSLIKTVEMTKGDKGVWSYTEPCGHGIYYTYTVTTSVGTQTTTDPYAKAVGLNGNRSMVIDLDLTDPEGWGAEFDSGIENYSDAYIWEVHVRDFSNKIEASQYKGKYLAFTERGLKNSAGEAVGVDYLVNLGITHVHLLPVYDYATVDESNPDAQFNWGYDPKNYNSPEGSYSTNPYDGSVRINEYKQMVMGLHKAGIGVVMDVVYNHTYDANSSFNKIVPYYYYRYTASGANSSASGCGNDTASERYMFRKFMVDSVIYWAEEYDLDGFRFDLMGLHDLETMRLIEKAVHEINPDAIIYGEGWSMGATIDGSAQANQTNISKIEASEGAAGGIAVFNDAIRDGLKGSVFTETSKGYINGVYSTNESKVRFGMNGGRGGGMGWQVQKAMVINYMSAHDNHTLWDKLAIANSENTHEERLKMNKLGAAIIAVSLGTPFMQAGEEMLRTKGGDENSYKSSDDVNNIDWEALVPGSDAYNTMLYYKGLIEMRKEHSIFRAPGGVAISFTTIEGGGMCAKYDNHRGGKALVLINPTEESVTHTISGEWKLVGTNTAASAEIMAIESGEIELGAYSIRIYVN